jgi:hypothetical protein
VLTRPIPPASRYGRSPESLDAICFKALQRSPNKRYQSAEEMLVHLRKVAASADLLGSPSEVKQWVKEVMGHDLDVQRLSFLDAARMAREAEANESVSLMPARTRREEAPASEASRTIELGGKGDQQRTVAKWIAVGLGLGIILLAALLPDTIKTLGKVKPASKDPAAAPLAPGPRGTGDSLDPSTVASAAPLGGAGQRRVMAAGPDAGAR